ncbi:MULTISPECIES: hypothetical protein [unclassified Spirosoma]|uniref:hypothetical protein n=1 Tax=unclassified Spirosoma TaxID=2621999 RepID=UPI00095EF82C|nr:MULTISPECIES: hypothetical protein [unclassified Spirosoma]MBN8823644.1 hypothetical protein [Spirosoma sp.]OJW76801.1 MAG: hypothetical protein BGO59_21450 [Spirosoma sp. 48-14]
MNVAYLSRNRSLVVGRFDRLAWVLIGIPIVCFSLLLFAYIVDVPWMDDIDAFLSFIVGYIDAPTVERKIYWLLSPNNEHRILTGKLLTLLCYNLTGAVNFRWLIFAAFAFLLVLLAIFYRVFRLTGLPILAFVPIPFLLLQPQYYLTTTWAITSLQHQVVVAMVIAVIYLLADGSRSRFGIGLILQVLTSFSMSNGLFGWVAGAVVLVMQRQWVRLGIWLAVGGGAIVYYFHDFPNTQGNDSSVSFFLEHPHLIFLGFFTFNGGLFDFLPETSILVRSILPTLAGLILIPAMLWLLWQMAEPILRRPVRASANLDRATAALWKRRYFLTGCYAFLMVNAVVVAFLRPRFGYAVMLISNYMIYPALLVVLLYLNVLSEQYKNSRVLETWVRAGLVVGFVVWGAWYVFRLPKIAFRKEQLLTSAFNQKYNETGLGPSWGHPFVSLARRSLDQAVQRGLYQYPTDAYYSAYEQILLTKGRSMKPDTSLTLHRSGGGYSYLVETDYGVLPKPVGQSAVVVQSDQRTYLFASSVHFSPANFYLNRPIQTVFAEVIIPMLPPGTYRLGILTTSDEATTPIRFSPQTITIP